MRRKLLILLVIVGVFGCSKDSTSPDNPFDATNQQGGNDQDTLDPTSFAGLHKQIFSQRCANPLCHDGSFEPDFRTMESAYNNLVYHPVIKNTSTNDFTYRVVPYDTENSWLIERLETDDVVLGRMPLYANPLSEKEINNIKKWINEGCKNILGQVPKFPNLQPQVVGRAAFDQNQIRIDTAYDGSFPSPFKVAPGSTVNLLIQVRDDSTASNKLSNAKVKFSYEKEDFSNALVKNATYFTQDYYSVQFMASEFTANKKVYFRFYCEDGDHSSPAEFPKESTLFYYKELFAFIVK